MAASNDLYDLLATLSKSEKRYCRLMLASGAGRRSSSCLRLFEILSPMGEFDEARVRHAVRAEAFAGHLSVTKNHLYHHLVKSLRALRGEPNIRSHIRALVDAAEMLSERGLHSQAHERIARARMLADAGGYLPESLEIERLEWLVETREQYRGVAPGALEERRRRVAGILDRLENYWDYLGLYARVSVALLADGPLRSDGAAPVDWVAEHPLIVAPTPCSPGAERFYFETLRLYYMLTARYAEGFEYCSAYLERIDRGQMGSPADPMLRMQVLYTHIALAIKVSQPDVARHACDALRSIVPATREERTEHAQLSFNGELLVHMIDLDYRAIEAMAPRLAAVVGGNGGVMSQDELAYYVNLAYAQFANGQLRSAAASLHRVLNDHRVGFRNDVLRTARILHLMVNYDLGEHELLPYLIRSTYRLIAGCNHLHRFERALLRLLRRLANVAGNDALFRELRLMRDELAIIAGDPREHEASTAYVILAWIDSKLTGVDLGELLRRKEPGAATPAAAAGRA